MYNDFKYGLPILGAHEQRKPIPAPPGGGGGKMV